MAVNKQALVQLCVDYKNNPDKVAHFSKGADVESKIREQFFELMGTEKPNAKDIRRHKVEIFEILETVLAETWQQGIQEDQFFMQYCETRSLNLGDSQEFYVEDDAILVVSEHSGANWNISRQKLEGGESFTIKTKPYAIAVYGDFYLFATGRLSFARLIEKVAQAIQIKIYEEVAASFAQAVTKLPTQFTFTGTYDEAKLQEIVAHVEAVSGSPAVVIGTNKGLSKVINGQNVTWYSDAMKTERNNTGKLGVVNGINLAYLPSVHKANTFEFAYDDNQLLIVPQNIGQFIKLVLEGDDLMKEVQDNTVNMDMSFEYKFITRFGTGVIFDKLFGIYTLA